MKKTLSTIATILVVCVIVLIGAKYLGESDADRYLRQQLQTTKLENQIARAEAWGQISLALVYVAGVAGGLSLLALPLAVFGLTGKLTRSHRAEDGLYPILVERPGILARLQGNRDPIVVNPNLQGTAVARYRELRDGVQMIAPAIDETQATVTAAAQRIQMVQAMTSDKGRLSAAAGRLLAGSYDPRNPRDSILDDTPALPAPYHRPMTLKDALTHAQTEGEIVLGQDHDNGNRPAIWRPSAVPHFAIWGSSQQSKSEGLGYTIALGLIAAGYHLVVLDVEEEAQWAELSSHVEYHATDATLFSGQVEALAAEWRRRGDVLQRYGSPNWSSLPAQAGERRMAVVVEEYSYIRAAAADFGNLADQDRAMSDMATKGGKRGMHMVILDQHYKGMHGKWPAPVLNNVAARASFRQPVEDNTLVGYHGLAKLERGVFAYNGERFTSYHARPHARTLLATIPALDLRPVVRPVRPFVPGWEAPPLEVDPPSPSRTGEPNGPAEPTPVVDVESDLQKAARAWITERLAQGETATQVEMRKALAPHNGGEEVSKGWAWDLWHTYHPEGTKYQPAKAEPVAPRRDWGYIIAMDDDRLTDLMASSTDEEERGAAFVELRERGQLEFRGKKL